MNWTIHTRFLVGVVALSFSAAAQAQDTLRLREEFPAGYSYQVSMRVELSGSLTLPDAKGGALKVSGASAIDYDERVLGVDPAGRVHKTIRLYRRIDFQRQVGDQQQQ